MDGLPPFLPDLEALAAAAKPTDLSLGADGHLQLGNQGRALAAGELEERVRDCFMQSRQYYQQHGETAAYAPLLAWQRGEREFAQITPALQVLDRQVKLIGKVKAEALGKEFGEVIDTAFPFLTTEMYLPYNERDRYTEMIAFTADLDAVLKTYPALEPKLKALTDSEFKLAIRGARSWSHKADDKKPTTAEDLQHLHRQLEAACDWVRRIDVGQHKSADWYFARLAVADNNGLGRDALQAKMAPLIARFGMRAVCMQISQVTNRRADFAKAQETHEKVLEALTKMEADGASIAEPLASLIRADKVEFYNAIESPRLMEVLARDWVGNESIVHYKLPERAKSGYDRDLYQQRIISLLNIYLRVSEENRLGLYALLCQSYLEGGFSVKALASVDDKRRLDLIPFVCWLGSQGAHERDWISIAERWVALAGENAAVTDLLLRAPEGYYPQLRDLVAGVEHPAQFNETKATEALAKFMTANDLLNIKDTAPTLLDARMAGYPEPVQAAFARWRCALARVAGLGERTTVTTEELPEAFRVFIRDLLNALNSRRADKEWPVVEVVDWLTGASVAIGWRFCDVLRKIGHHWNAAKYIDLMIKNERLIDLVYGSKSDSEEILNQINYCVEYGKLPIEDLLQVIAQPPQEERWLTGYRRLLEKHPSLQDVLKRILEHDRVTGQRVITIVLNGRDVPDDPVPIRTYCEALLSDGELRELLRTTQACSPSFYMDLPRMATAYATDPQRFLRILRLAKHHNGVMQKLVANSFGQAYVGPAEPSAQRVLKFADDTQAHHPKARKWLLDLMAADKNVLADRLLKLYEAGQTDLVFRLLEVASRGEYDLLTHLLDDAECDNKTPRMLRPLAAASAATAPFLASLLLRAPQGAARVNLARRYGKGEDVQSELLGLIGHVAVTPRPAPLNPPAPLVLEKDLPHEAEAAKRIAEAAVGPSGEVDLRVLQQIPATEYYLGVGEHSLHRRYLDNLIRVLSEHPEYVAAIEQAPLPKPGSQAFGLLQAMYGDKTPDWKPTAHHAVCAVLSALLTAPRQAAIGSCFGTGTEVAEHWSARGIRQLIEDYSSVLACDRIRRTQAGNTVSVVDYPFYLSTVADDKEFSGDNLLARAHEFCVATMGGSSGTSGLPVSVNLEEVIPRILDSTLNWPKQLRALFQRTFRSDLTTSVKDLFQEQAKQIFLPHLPGGMMAEAAGVWVLTRKRDDHFILNSADYTAFMRGLFEESEKRYLAKHDQTLTADDRRILHDFFHGPGGVYERFSSERFVAVVLSTYNVHKALSSGIARHFPRSEYVDRATQSPWLTTSGASGVDVQQVYRQQLTLHTAFDPENPEQLLRRAYDTLLSAPDSSLQELRQRTELRTLLGCPQHACGFLPGSLLAVVEASGGPDRLIVNLKAASKMIADHPLTPAIGDRLEAKVVSSVAGNMREYQFRGVAAGLRAQSNTVGDYVRAIMHHFTETQASKAFLRHKQRMLDQTCLNDPDLIAYRQLAVFGDTNWSEKASLIYFVASVINGELDIYVGPPDEAAGKVEPLYEEAIPNGDRLWRFDASARVGSDFDLIGRPK